MQTLLNWLVLRTVVTNDISHESDSISAVFMPNRTDIEFSKESKLALLEGRTITPYPQLPNTLDFVANFMQVEWRFHAL